MRHAHAFVRSVLMIAALSLVVPSLVGVNLAEAKPRKASKASKAKKKPAEIKLPPAEPPPVDDATAQTAPPVRGPTRIDFDERLLQGQMNKSGAVYLYDRKELKTRSMIKKRESFREEIITSVYDG